MPVEDRLEKKIDGISISNNYTIILKEMTTYFKNEVCKSKENWKSNK